ncbi:MAG TPA: hypothetical protein IAA75_08895 [Candidatus Pullichristensenella avicola]|nr:hypothetical protein [Candidatus Pullichristensenella avicola]
MKRNRFLAAFQLWAAGYAVLTVVSSIAQLCNGMGTDTNINILARAAACLVPIAAYYAFGFGTQRKRSKGILMLAAHYLISLGCAWLLIYLAGLLQKNADVAYVDMLISFTVAYAAIAIVVAIANRRARREGASME